MSLAVVLLAAGNSSRFNGPKLLAQLDGISLVRRAAEAALETGAALVVVTGAYADEVKAELQGLAATLVHNADWSEGMGNSIACAFRYLIAQHQGVEAAIVLPSDLPRVHAPQLQRLIDAHTAAPQRIGVSEFGEACGPPCLFPAHYFNELAQLSGPQGARSVLAKHALHTQRIAMPEAAVDIDTAEDHAREGVRSS